MNREIIKNLKTATNPIEAMQEILDTMKGIEQNYFQFKKTEETLNNRQSDLLHALELDLDEEEEEAVNKALREIRDIRRDTKDFLINLTEAQAFIKENYKFMSECEAIVKKMQRTAQKVANRKYFLRDCDAISKVIKMDKYCDIIHPYIPREERIKDTSNDARPSIGERFESKWVKNE